MGRTKYVGLDIGNYDVKTQNTSIVTGYGRYIGDEPGFGFSEYVQCGSTIYHSSTTRLSYRRDKTENDDMFILSLMGIASELVFQAKQDCSKLGRQATHENVQNILNEIDIVHLGIGVPPADVSSLARRYMIYYRDKFGDGVEYKYKGDGENEPYVLKYNLGEIRCYPQDFAAILTYKPENKEDSAISYDKYYGIDIGGYTVDIVAIQNKRVVPEECTSLSEGVIVMIREAIEARKKTIGDDVEFSAVDGLYAGRKAFMTEEKKAYFKNALEEHYKRIINRTGINFQNYPVVFLGGGSLLFKDCIMNDDRIIHKEIISDPKANAIAYSILLKKEVK